jgi:hypothetical protein
MSSNSTIGSIFSDCQDAIAVDVDAHVSKESTSIVCGFTFTGKGSNDADDGDDEKKEKPQRSRNSSAVGSIAGDLQNKLTLRQPGSAPNSAPETSKDEVDERQERHRSSFSALNAEFKSGFSAGEKEEAPKDKLKTVSTKSSSKSTKPADAGCCCAIQ